MTLTLTLDLSNIKAALALYATRYAQTRMRDSRLGVLVLNTKAYARYRYSGSLLVLCSLLSLLTSLQRLFSGPLLGLALMLVQLLLSLETSASSQKNCYGRC
jgi:hypothetical protein